MPAPGLPDEHVETLRQRVRGDVLRPGDEGYDASRAVWNAMIDKRPAIIVKSAGTADVIAAVDIARNLGVLLSVKGGGHHVSGTAVCDGGITIDMSEMNAVSVDPDERTARVQAGATWGDVDHETQAFGLATPGGQEPNIGVAGLTLGGGVGWLSRKFGMTIDNLLEVKLVTADGRVVTASDARHPELFWALRGGGGNFGVATSFTYRLYAVGPDVLAGSVVYPLEEAREAMRFYDTFMASAPDELRTLFGIMVLPDAPHFPEEIRDERVAIVISCYTGETSAGRDALAPVRQFGNPIADTIRRRRYTAFQRAGTSEERQRTDLRSQYMETLSPAAIEVMVDRATKAPSPGSTLFVSHRGGAETDPAPDATAYPHRHDAHHVLIEARWTDPAEDEEHLVWVREFHDSLRPYITGAPAINFLTADESRTRVEEAYGVNYEKLVCVKNEWDPTNLFRMNQNIPPSSQR